MHSFFKKIGAALLSAVLAFSAVSVAASAADPADGMTYVEEMALFEKINDGISALTEQEPHRNEPEDAKEEKAAKLLNTYQAEGLVEDVTFCEDSGMYTFTYFNGYLGALETRDPDPMCNGSSDGLPDVLLPEPEEILPEAVGTSNAASSYSGEALVLFSFNLDTDDPEYREPFYTTLKNDWDSRGLQTDVDMQVTVTDMKNIQSKYDVVCFSGHGAMYGSQPFMSLSEKKTSSNLSAYQSDLNAGRIFVINGERYGVLPSLFTDSYGSSHFANTFIFSESCKFYGKDGTYTYAFADAFTSRGASAVFGYHNSVYSTYSRNSMQYWVNRMLESNTAQEAFNQTIARYGSDDEVWYQSIYGKASDRESIEYAVPKLRGTASAKLINDLENPTGSITTTTSVASSQTVTLHLSDDQGVAGYYWGQSSSYSGNTYYTTSALEVTRTVSSSGSYYLTVKDISGKLSSTVSITYYLITLNANGGSVSPSTVLMRSGYLLSWLCIMP